MESSVVMYKYYSGWIHVVYLFLEIRLYALCLYYIRG